MEFNNYLTKKVQIVLNNGFTYIGVVVSADNNSLTLIDKTNSKVCLKESTINFLKEIL